MNRKIKTITNGLLAVIATLLLVLAAFAARPQSVESSGTAWGTGTFRSNGERIYFAATSERGKAITYTGGPVSSGWMMMGGRLACVSCHGPNGQGGKHSMGMMQGPGMMQGMDAKDIRWSCKTNSMLTNFVWRL